MSANHSEARERARQEFEKCLRCLYIQVPAEIADFIRSKFEEYEAAGRSLEQERDAILERVECAYNMLPSNAAGACYELRTAIHKLRAVHKGDS